MSISRLETQLRDAFEDAEFYRIERDYFKSIVFQQPGAERHYARPTSPRLRRSSVAPSNAPSSTTGGGSADSPYSAYDDDLRESERIVRRRTSNYHPSAESVSMPVNGPGGPSTAYSAPGFHSVNDPSSAGMTRRTQSFDPRDQRPLPELQEAPHQPPVLRDPFAPSNSGHFDNRNWAPGQARDNR